MSDFHGIIFAYNTFPELRDLVKRRTAASLPFCGRYRLIDFALSSMANAGICNVGVIMQRDYQSLLDHLGSGKAWDMSRRVGGLRMLPPFGLPDSHNGQYAGTMEALNAVSTYIQHSVREKYIVLMLGNTCANIDLAPAMEQHIASGNPITAICADHNLAYPHFSYLKNEDGIVSDVLFGQNRDEQGVSALEAYIINKDTLMNMMDYCASRGLCRFHDNGIRHFMEAGGKMGIYVHPGYAELVRDVPTYRKANLDMLLPEIRAQMFPAHLPVRTKVHEEVSTYYGEHAVCRSSLVADNCIIEGTVENSIIFSGCRIYRGAVVRNCIVMRGAVIGKNSELENVICDKNTIFTTDSRLIGSEKLPILVPKDSVI